MPDADDQPRRRASDRRLSLALHPDAYKFPDSENPTLMLLLGQMLEKQDTYADDAAEARKQLSDIRDILKEHTRTLADQTGQLDRLRTAITTEGFFNAGKTWAPIITIITAVVAFYYWIGRHWR